MKKIAIALFALALPQFSWGQLIFFEAHLDGAQSGVVTPGTGFASGSVDISSFLFTLDYTFSDLLAPQTAAHIHRGAAGVNGPVVIGAPTFPLGSSIHYTTTINAGLVNDLLNNNLYLNIHSQLHRGGEIRGQLVAVPEPSTYALAGAAILGVMIVHRRRRARLAPISS
jgi:hypothetical protein